MRGVLRGRDLLGVKIERRGAVVDPGEEEWSPVPARRALREFGDRRPRSVEIAEGVAYAREPQLGVGWTHPTTPLRDGFDEVGLHTQEIAGSCTSRGACFEQEAAGDDVPNRFSRRELGGDRGLRPHVAGVERHLGLGEPGGGEEQWIANADAEATGTLDRPSRLLEVAERQGEHRARRPEHDAAAFTDDRALRALPVAEGFAHPTRRERYQD